MTAQERVGARARDHRGQDLVGEQDHRHRDEQREHEAQRLGGGALADQAPDEHREDQVADQAQDARGERQCVGSLQQRLEARAGALAARLAEAGRTGSITREELNGSTITITSAGSIGGLFATPVINHPEVAILGVYRMEDRPVVIDGEIVVRKMMYMSITLDHRVLDGGEAARFMNTMKRLLGDPRTMLMEG